MTFLMSFQLKLRTLVLKNKEENTLSFLKKTPFIKDSQINEEDVTVLVPSISI